MSLSSRIRARALAPDRLWASGGRQRGPFDCLQVLGTGERVGFSAHEAFDGVLEQRAQPVRMRLAPAARARGRQGPDVRWWPSWWCSLLNLSFRSGSHDGRRSASVLPEARGGSAWYATSVDATQSAEEGKRRSYRLTPGGTEGRALRDGARVASVPEWARRSAQVMGALLAIPFSGTQARRQAQPTPARCRRSGNPPRQARRGPHRRGAG